MLLVACEQHVLLLETLKNSDQQLRYRNEHTTEETISTSAQVEIRIKFIFDFFEKKFKFLGLHAVASTREDLSIDASITNVGLILIKPG